LHFKVDFKRHGVLLADSTMIATAQRLRSLHSTDATDTAAGMGCTRPMPAVAQERCSAGAAYSQGLGEERVLFALRVEDS
jgi:hypothetical protein